MEGEDISHALTSKYYIISPNKNKRYCCAFDLKFNVGPLGVMMVNLVHLPTASKHRWLNPSQFTQQGIMGTYLE
jgi:hypothetical protein